MGESGALVGIIAVLVILITVIGAFLARAIREGKETVEASVEEVEVAERRLASVLATGRDGIVGHSATGKVVMISEAAAELFDTSVSALVGKPILKLPVRWVSEQGEEVGPRRVFAESSSPRSDEQPFVVGVQPDTGASIRWVHVITRPISTASGHELLTILVDVTEPREVRAALARSQTQFRLAMENAPIGMALVDPQWRVLRGNAALGRLLGIEPSAVAGRDLSSLSHPDDQTLERTEVERLLSGDGGRFTLEKRYLRRDGQTLWVMLDVVLVRAPNGSPDVFVAQMRDVTDSRMQSEILEQRALRDPLTGLANRSLMQEALQNAVEPADAEGRVAVLAIDLDEFKLINDRFGHAAGDDVLIHVAGVLRAATAGRGTVARLGGDEFLVIVEDEDAGRTAFEVGAKIHKGLLNPVRTHRRQLPVRASIGIAVAEASILAGGAMGILAAADAALYRAKGAGRNRTEVYERSMVEARGGRQGVAAEIVQAIEQGELFLHYQPTVDLATGTVIGYEALVRWQHPERGLLLPAAFLPAVQEAGLAVALGTSVVRQVVAFLTRTQAGRQWVSVNVSMDQLGSGEVAGQMLTAISRNPGVAGRLVVELTEAALAESGGRVRRELVELRAAGIPVLLDDFGTGVAPLSYLRDLPVDGVKLDMSFTAGIPDDPAAARISKALGALARELGLITIAEGIETSEQATFLRSCGWDFGQGWLFGAGKSELVTAAPRIGN